MLKQASPIWKKQRLDKTKHIHKSSLQISISLYYTGMPFAQRKKARKFRVNLTMNINNSTMPAAFHWSNGEY